ncbi:AglZ/HisF2 family acetamidino modification protein [Pseudomonas sp. KNUC1026]|uniref:AglZ/HisF2 family acetamidino modification protein n=1 Tax=Pseudomonas sp. KNUC1026 TaxID=2893890 RepID=UPI001F18697E|nr:AglZ/HisF2 family acetamidino modification protein [Pseudomonas sp. KNUC1026]UFH48239.1 AglZ/HisF2 family acetamidino modification protein [Pseudomonas sp. KNUC1026]
MLRSRVIPCLLLKNKGLVKTVKFKDHKYVGDPLNAVKIFNEKSADELMLLDIDASITGSEPDYALIQRMALECRMPFCYGGGIKTAEQAKRIIALGVEKVAISSAAIARPDLIGEIASEIGSQSVAVVLDVKKKLLGNKYQVVTLNAKTSSEHSVMDLIDIFQAQGVGEVVINSVDLDGTMKGYNIELASFVKSLLKVPLTMLGGAGSLADIEALVNRCGIIGAGVGSLFVFKGAYRAVLINYPNPLDKERIVNSSQR